MRAADTVACAVRNRSNFKRAPTGDAPELRETAGFWSHLPQRRAQFLAYWRDHAAPVLQLACRSAELLGQPFAGPLDERAPMGLPCVQSAGRFVE